MFAFIGPVIQVRYYQLFLMETLSQKRIERSAKVRLKGRRQYIVRRTIFYSMVPLAAAVIVRLVKYPWTGELQLGSIPWGERLIASKFFMVLGYFHARWEWSSGEEL